MVATALAAGVVAVWAGAAAGAFSPLVLLACLAAFLSFYLVGSLCAGWQDLAAGTLFDLPLRLLVGYIVVNTSLFALAWLSPLGLIADFAILLAVAILLFLVKKPRRREPDEQVGLLVLGVSLVAATLWCQDSIRPTFVDEHAVWFKPWIDGFYHAVHIRTFGASHGTIEDFRLAGVPARLYHYGDYLTPALIWRVGGISSYSVFAGVLAPRQRLGAGRDPPHSPDQCWCQVVSVVIQASGNASQAEVFDRPVAGAKGADVNGVIKAVDPRFEPDRVLIHEGGTDGVLAPQGCRDQGDTEHEETDLLVRLAPARLLDQEEQDRDREQDGEVGNEA